MKCQWHRGGCDYPAFKLIRGIAVCIDCYGEFSTADQMEAESIPLCEGADEDGEPCQERPGERLCAHCRELEEGPAC